MAVKATNQMTLIDLTDAYSVHLTCDNVTWLGDTDSVSGTQTITTQVIAMRGSEQVPCKVGAMSPPSGMAAVSDGKSPSPTITITANSSVTKPGSFSIPIIIEGEITINKVFAYSIAYKGTTGDKGNPGAAGVGIKSIAEHYAVSNSSTTAPTSWQDTPPVMTATNKYLWNYETITYTNGTTSDTAKRIIGAYGNTGGTGATGNGVKSVTNYYLASTASSGVTTETSGWTTTVQPITVAKRYLWNYEIITYTNGSTSKTTPAVIGVWGNTGEPGKPGDPGAPGADAITLVVTSSAGTIFKNTNIATTLTAHVYSGGKEITGSALTALGTIKWYKDGGTTAVGTGQTFTISAGDVTSKATYTAQLEG